MFINDFDFELNPELIARYPLSKRSDSRLLCITRSNDNMEHRHFYELMNLVAEGDLLIFNDSKVIPARLQGLKRTGGRVEVFVERVLNKQTILAQVKASKRLHIGDHIYFSKDITLVISNSNEQFYELRYLKQDQTIIDVIESIGQIPLPHYMHRLPEETDKTRYQTVYARHKGSVAAPTAGLHFDEELLEKLHKKNILFGHLTLHIGAGTFKPVRVENIAEHKMHAEYVEVPPSLCVQIETTKARGKRIIAVGTTAMRALETASQSGKTESYSGETNIFIYPGYTFKCVDVLITNLHLPRSSLLMLVCAFGGYKRIMEAYQEAIRNNYRFYSYGDAMWIERFHNS